MTAPIPTAPVLLPIVEQHAEEAAFLWLLRDAAVDAPHYAPRHLARLEERLDAHIDGLRVAGEVGFGLAHEQVCAFPEPGEVFTAAVLALEGGMDRLAPILERVQAAPEAERGLIGALGWTSVATLSPYVRGWLTATDAFERLLGVVACSLHRADPGDRLPRLLTDPNVRIRARAWRLAGELGRSDLAGRAAEAVGSEPDPDARFWAAWSAGLLGRQDAAADILLRAAEGSGPAAERALDVLTRVLPPARTAAWLRALNGNEGKRLLVVRALGRFGDPAGIPWLIGCMGDPRLARAAGESIALITGLDLAFEDLDGSAPEGAETGPSEHPGDDSVELDRDADLPWPDAERVAAWWARNGSCFPPGTRHLLGQPTRVETAEAAFAHGYQRQRRAAAYEIARLGAGSPKGLPNWRARL